MLAAQCSIQLKPIRSTSERISYKSSELGRDKIKSLSPCKLAPSLSASCKLAPSCSEKGFRVRLTKSEQGCGGGWCIDTRSCPSQLHIQPCSRPCLNTLDYGRVHLMDCRSPDLHLIRFCRCVRHAQTERECTALRPETEPTHRVGSR